MQDDPDIHWPAADIPDVDIPTAFKKNKRTIKQPTRAMQKVC